MGLELDSWNSHSTGGWIPGEGGSRLLTYTFHPQNTLLSQAEKVLRNGNSLLKISLGIDSCIHVGVILKEIQISDFISLHTVVFSEELKWKKR